MRSKKRRRFRISMATTWPGVQMPSREFRSVRNCTMHGAVQNWSTDVWLGLAANKRGTRQFRTIGFAGGMQRTAGREDLAAGGLQGGAAVEVVHHCGPGGVARALGPG